jgi:uncharacterized protein DUF1579
LRCLLITDDSKDVKDATSDTATKMDDKKPETYTMPDSATMMKNWQEYAAVGDMHKMLAKANGTWDGDITMWMPGAPEQKSKGVAVNKMIMGGRYQVSTNTGNMMGAPFEGISTVGYDNGKKMFVSSWIDNMGTGMMNLQGTWDDATKTITFKGKMVDGSLGGGREVDIRETFQLVDDTHQVMEMFVTGGDGKEFKSMHIDYTKRK